MAKYVLMRNLRCYKEKFAVKYAKCITQRRDGEEYISRQTSEQETTKGAHNKRQPTNAGQQRYSSHNGKLPTRPL